jgi:hypothetical protein
MTTCPFVARSERSGDVPHGRYRGDCVAKLKNEMTTKSQGRSDLVAFEVIADITIRSPHVRLSPKAIFTVAHRRQIEVSHG